MAEKYCLKCSSDYHQWFEVNLVRDYGGYIGYTQIEPKYCPCCGRKLEE